VLTALRSKRVPVTVMALECNDTAWSKPALSVTSACKNPVDANAAIPALLIPSEVAFVPRRLDFIASTQSMWSAAQADSTCCGCDKTALRLLCKSAVSLAQVLAPCGAVSKLLWLNVLLTTHLQCDIIH
jgi:hypothetical protein